MLQVTPNANKTQCGRFYFINSPLLLKGSAGWSPSPCDAADTAKNAAAMEQREREEVCLSFLFCLLWVGPPAPARIWLLLLRPAVPSASFGRFKGFGLRAKNHSLC